MDCDQKRRCQVQGCGADLVAEGPYCIKRKCCTQHIRADCVVKAGTDGLHRFCFQCGRLEPLENFDGAKRSCRARLQQRVKQSPKRRTTWTAGYNAGKKITAQAARSSHTVAATSSHSCASADASMDAAAAAEPVWQQPVLSHSSSCNKQQKQRRKQQKKPLLPADSEMEEADGQDRLQELHKAHLNRGFGAAAEAPHSANNAAMSLQPLGLCSASIARTQSDACVPAGPNVSVRAAAEPPAGGDVAWDDLLIQLCEASSEKRRREPVAAPDDAAQLMALLDRELSNAALLAHQTSLPAPTSSSSQNTGTGGGGLNCVPSASAFNLMADSGPRAATVTQLQQEQHVRQQQQQMQLLQLLRQQKQQRLAQQAQLRQAGGHGWLATQNGLATPATPFAAAGVASQLPSVQQQQQQQLATAAQLMQQYKCLLQQQQQLLAGPMAAAAGVQHGMLGPAAGNEAVRAASAGVTCRTCPRSLQMCRTCFSRHKC